MGGFASKVRSGILWPALPCVHLLGITICLLSVLALSRPAWSADPAGAMINKPAPVSTIVIGFVGGFVHRDDARHSEVQLAEKLRAEYPDRTHIELFENRQRPQARQAIHKWLDADADGSLSDTERRAARIVLYGHSWGASAVITLARELQRENIPVLLTVQVDSIPRRGQNDRVIPENVSKAVNFYQTRGILHGQPQITAADPSHTQILGDFRYDYKNEPTACRAYPWLNRHLFKGHTSIECDPQVWSRVESLIDPYLAAVDHSASATALQ